MNSNKKLGGSGEHNAELFLVNQGYRILDTNYRTPFGELDIIGIDGEALAFVEVKTRRTRKYGEPSYSITSQKQDHMAKSALFYLTKKKYEFSCYRFDVVSVECTTSGQPHINLIRNAFYVKAGFAF